MSQPCEICGRPAVYYSWKRKRLTTAEDHPLCRRCYRAERNRWGHNRGPILFPIEIPTDQREC